MKKFAFTLILLTLFIFACKTTPDITKEKSTKILGTAEYYQKYQRNIDRLYQMLQGTFVCYLQDSSVGPTPILWKINQDSIITYSIPIKEPAKDGYWLICYQFITSLPDEPIYCALQRITLVDRDTFLSDFFESPTEIKLSSIIKDLNKIDQSIDLKKLVPTGESITHYREEITLFKGFSNIYKDHQNQKLVYRQDNHEVFPDKIKLKAKYFSDTKGKELTSRVAKVLISVRTQKSISDIVSKSFLEE